MHKFNDATENSRVIDCHGHYPDDTDFACETCRHWRGGDSGCSLDTYIEDERDYDMPMRSKKRVIRKPRWNEWR